EPDEASVEGDGPTGVPVARTRLAPEPGTLTLPGDAAGVAGGQSVLANDVAEIRRSGTSRDARLPDGEGDGRVQADHRVVEDLVTGDDGADDTRLLIVTQDDRGIDVIAAVGGGERSEEHTSELQSRFDLVCRLL